MAPAAGLTIANADGVVGNPTFALANDLAALEAIAVAKGSLIAGDATPAWAGLAVGADGRHLVADSTATTGLRWVPSAASGTLTRAAATGSGTEDVAHGLGVAPAVMFFIAKDDLTAAINSNGWAHGTSIFAFTGSHTVASRSGQTTCVDILSSIGDGHNASVSAVDATNFTLNWTKAGAGRAITVKWVAVA